MLRQHTTHIEIRSVLTRTNVAVICFTVWTIDRTRNGNNLAGTPGRMECGAADGGEELWVPGGGKLQRLHKNQTPVLN